MLPDLISFVANIYQAWYESSNSKKFNYDQVLIIPIPKNNAILPMGLQLLSNNNTSVIFIKIIGIK